MQGSCRWHQNPRVHGSQARGKRVRLKENKWVKWYIGTSSKKSILMTSVLWTRNVVLLKKKNKILTRVFVCIGVDTRVWTQAWLWDPKVDIEYLPWSFPHFTYWNKLYCGPRDHRFQAVYLTCLTRKMPGLCTWEQRLKVGHIPIWCSYGCQDQLQAFCFHEEHFIHWAISAVPDLIKNFKQPY